MFALLVIKVVSYKPHKKKCIFLFNQVSRCNTLFKCMYVFFLTRVIMTEVLNNSDAIDTCL